MNKGWNKNLKHNIRPFCVFSKLFVTVGSVVVVLEIGSVVVVVVVDIGSVVVGGGFVLWPTVQCTYIRLRTHLPAR